MNIKKIALTISLLAGLQVSHTQTMRYAPTWQGIKTRLGNIKTNLYNKITFNTVVLTVALAMIIKEPEMYTEVFGLGLALIPPFSVIAAPIQAYKLAFHSKHLNKLLDKFANQEVPRWILLGSTWGVYQAISFMKTPTTPTQPPAVTHEEDQPVPASSTT